ncbi:hypothetical protein FB567DRAFT_333459 [Paraphoma chrysanthemicola]|uniref:AAA+ ATPase domain-containing protein n=1 Tax=Paraphoma chrysanthemicola TaxID=798071 RepID=A0A8K0VZL8_9PLEO|nr:hypothetical protein FB567DRAFT_333459 [Paraphoma chrysanthemicola]
MRSLASWNRGMADTQPPSPVSLSEDNAHDKARFANGTDRSSGKEGQEELVNEVSDDIPPEATPDPDTEAGAEEGASGQEVLTSKAPHREKVNLDRIGVAIDKARDAGQNTLDTSSQDRPEGPRFINVRFGPSDCYVVPWEAVRSWKQVEVLLMEWYHEDEDVLKEVEDGDITVQGEGAVIILPQTWANVVEHNAHIQIWPHSSYDDSSSSEASVEDEEACYENRVQYVVNYYQTVPGDDTRFFMNRATSDKPVNFEVVDRAEKLPVLEETKEITTPQYIMPKKEDDGEDKKARIGTQDRVISTRLKINSPFLLNILRSVVAYTTRAPDGQECGLGPGLYDHPYQELYHHMPDLMRYKTEKSELRAKHSDAFNEKFDEHIDLLWHYLSEQPAVPIKECQARWESKTPSITFATCWLLLQPGTDVYVREDDGSLNAYVIHTVTGGVGEKDGRKTSTDYEVIMWSLAYNGNCIGPDETSVTIKVFDNEREITSLPVFPVRFIDDIDEGVQKSRLIVRGKQYFRYAQHPSFLEYSGPGLKEGAKKYNRSRVVVEHTTRPWRELLAKGYTLKHVPLVESTFIRESVRVPRCECKECTTAVESQETYEQDKFHDYYTMVPSENIHPTEHQYMLMAPRMYAFILKDRTYDLLDVEGLSEPDMAENAIENLVMENDDKELIKAIAKIYTDSGQSNLFSADFIHGKGEGQIILLHGPPGTGKTLTAESVAEFTRRPLLSITAADLGHEPEALERSLLSYFKRASDWDAIVLLDEADVYLERRTIHDLKRNSIVSVFLRALDYFQGILFLTTNRVGHFDEAFMSRIHLSLGYDKLDDNARVKIWDNLFKKLKDDHKRGGLDIRHEYDAKMYVRSKEVQALEWNGREIRNAFQTAVALAVYDWKHKKNDDHPEVTENHLKQVVSMSSAFRKYMKAAHSGMDDSALALKYGNREDGFPSTPLRQV